MIQILASLWLWLNLLYANFFSYQKWENIASPEKSLEVLNIEVLYMRVLWKLNQHKMWVIVMFVTLLVLWF